MMPLYTSQTESRERKWKTKEKPEHPRTGTILKGLKYTELPEEKESKNEAEEVFEIIAAKRRNVPDSPVIETPHSQYKGAQVWSLVRQLDPTCCN